MSAVLAPTLEGCLILKVMAAKAQKTKEWYTAIIIDTTDGCQAKIREDLCKDFSTKKKAEAYAKASVMENLTSQVYFITKEPESTPVIRFVRAFEFKPRLKP